jgi:hypothetical protein
MKKLLTSTALIGALVITSTSFAETKFGGNVENTWTSKSSKTTAKPAEDSVDQIGTDIEITMEHTKKLSNGWTAKIAAAIDESGETINPAGDNDGLTISRSYVQLSNGAGLTLQIGSEGLQGAEFYPIPTVADISSDIGAAGTIQQYSESLNDTNAIGIAYATGFGTFEALFAPDGHSSKGNGDANINARAAAGATGAGVEAAYKFNALNKALTGHIGYLKINNDNDVTSHAQEKNLSASVQYNFGKVKVGAGRTELDAGGTFAEAKERTTTTDSFGITLAATDQLSFGIQYSESSSDLAAANADEEVTTFQAAYDFGGIGFSLSLVQADNVGMVRGTDNEVLMLRTRTAF